METPSQAPVTSLGVSLSVIVQLPVGVLLILRLSRLISWVPCSEFCWQALLCSGLGCVHPGLAVWVLGTLPELGNHLVQRVFFGFFFFFVSQLFPFPPVVGTFLTGKDRAE